MRSPFANPVLLTVALLAGYACSNGGKSTLPNSPDGSVGSGGAVGSGGILSSGGKPAASGGIAAGGVTNTGGVSSTGGIASAGGAVGSGGAAGGGGAMSSGGMTASGGVASGGVMSSGGTSSAAGGAASGGLMSGGGTSSAAGGATSGGAMSSGGTSSAAGGAASGGAMSSGGTSSAAGGVATGGTGTGGAISTGGTAGTGDAGVDVAGTAPSCSCATGTTSWDCYCMAYASACATNLGAYYSDAGIGSSVVAIQEYANCNLVVVTTTIMNVAYPQHVYDRTTGLLVGEKKVSDIPTPCPFGADAGSFWSLSAGRFPDSTCVRSKCVLVGSPPPGVSCGDAGI